MPFPILFGTTVTTVLHYRADCDSHTVLSLILYITVRISAALEINSSVNMVDKMFVLPVTRHISYHAHTTFVAIAVLLLLDLVCGTVCLQTDRLIACLIDTIHAFKCNSKQCYESIEVRSPSILLIGLAT